MELGLAELTLIYTDTENQYVLLRETFSSLFVHEPLKKPNSALTQKRGKAEKIINKKGQISSKNPNFEQNFSPSPLSSSVYRKTKLPLLLFFATLDLKSNQNS